jgi:hypothetical protein
VGYNGGMKRYIQIAMAYTAKGVNQVFQTMQGEDAVNFLFTEEEARRKMMDIIRGIPEETVIVREVSGAWEFQPDKDAVLALLQQSIDEHWDDDQFAGAMRNLKNAPHATGA